MSVAVYYGKGNAKDEYVPVCGQSEVESLWAPIIATSALPILEVAVTGGLSVDDALYSDLLKEVKVVCREIEARVPYMEDVGNATFRCRRLRRILETHPPKDGWRLYIG